MRSTATAHRARMPGLDRERGTHRAPRRADRRRRPLRHRRRPPPAGALPGQELRDPRGARATSAAPGTSSATPGSARTPTCTRSATASSPGPTAKSIADGDSILDYVRETAARGRDRPPGSASTTASSRADWSSEEARWTVEAERTDSGETVQLTCGFLCVLQRLLPLRRGLHARVPGHRALRRRGRPPAALARGPRLRGQAGRRDRQRRDRGDAGAGDGRDGRARDDAAALADLHRLDAGRRPDRQRRCAASCPTRPPTRSCAGRTSSCRWLFYQLSRRRPELVKKLIAQGRSKRAAGRLRRRHALQAHATTPGTSACAWCPTATSSRRSRDGSAEIVTDRIETFTEDGIELESGERARGRHHRHRDRPQPALPRRHGARRRRRGGRPRRER